MPLADTESLFRQHARFVVRFARRLGVSESDVDDVLQDVFVVAHARGGFQPGPASPATWLAEITLRIVMTRRRNARRRQTEPSGIALDPPSDAPDPERHAEALESLSLVQHALEQMDSETRAIFVLFEMEGASGEAIASALGIPRNAVYRRLFDARKQFATALRDGRPRR